MSFNEIKIGITAPGPLGRLTRGFKNETYEVMISDNAETTKGNATVAFISRYDYNPVSWAEMQKIKNEIFGEEITAIEYYPPNKTLIDNVNVYWMWIFDEGVLPMPILKK